MPYRKDINNAVPSKLVSVRRFWGWERRGILEVRRADSEGVFGTGGIEVAGAWLTPGRAVRAGTRRAGAVRVSGYATGCPADWRVAAGWLASHQYTRDATVIQASASMARGSAGRGAADLA